MTVESDEGLDSDCVKREGTRKEGEGERSVNEYPPQ